jgi:hypothetical protein
MKHHAQETRMPTHDATRRLYRKLVTLLGPDETDTLFTLIWKANGRAPTDFRSVYGTRNS